MSPFNRCEITSKGPRHDSPSPKLPTVNEIPFLPLTLSIHRAPPRIGQRPPSAFQARHRMNHFLQALLQSVWVVLASSQLVADDFGMQAIAHTGLAGRKTQENDVVAVVDPLNKPQDAFGSPGRWTSRQVFLPPRSHDSARKQASPALAGRNSPTRFAVEPFYTPAVSCTFRDFIHVGLRSPRVGWDDPWPVPRSSEVRRKVRRRPGAPGIDLSRTTPTATP